MATNAIPFFVSEVTIAQRLRDMLSTCETKADCSAWAQDYFDHADQLTFAEQRDLVALSVRHFAAHGRV